MMPNITNIAVMQRISSPGVKVPTTPLEPLNRYITVPFVSLGGIFLGLRVLASHDLSCEQWIPIKWLLGRDIEVFIPTSTRSMEANTFLLFSTGLSILEQYQATLPQ